MKANPKLIDLSGNGHDATCYNFGWNWNSGIGQYKLYIFDYDPDAVVGATEMHSAHITEVKKSNAALAWGVANVGTYKVKLNVSGITDDVILCLGTLEKSQQKLLVNGIHEYEITINKGYEYYGILSGFTGICNVTIEELPLYEDALVADGVDDYAEVTNIEEHSIKTIFANIYLTSENREDFKFVFSSRTQDKILNIALAYKKNAIAYNYRNGGYTYINGVLNKTLKGQDLLDIKHVATLINEIGNYGNTLKLFMDSINNDYWCNVALYSFIGFNRILTTKEINYVIKHYIES